MLVPQKRAHTKKVYFMMGWSQINDYLRQLFLRIRWHSDAPRLMYTSRFFYRCFQESTPFQKCESHYCPRTQVYIEQSMAHVTLFIAVIFVTSHCNSDSAIALLSKKPRLRTGKWETLCYRRFAMHSVQPRIQTTHFLTLVRSELSATYISHARVCLRN